MTPIRTNFRRFAAILLVCLTGCGGETGAGTGDAARPAPAAGEPLPAGTEGVPVELEYTVAGTPVVGETVAVELTVTTSLDRPVALAYRPAESGSLTFPDSQARDIELAPVPGSQPRPQQITVIPQREGRLFLNVTAGVETDTGSAIKSISVPIQVMPAPLSDAEAGTEPQ